MATKYCCRHPVLTGTTNGPGLLCCNVALRTRSKRAAPPTIHQDKFGAGWFFVLSCGQGGEVCLPCPRSSCRTTRARRGHVLAREGGGATRLANPRASTAVLPDYRRRTVCIAPRSARVIAANPPNLRRLPTGRHHAQRGTRNSTYPTTSVSLKLQKDAFPKPLHTQHTSTQAHNKWPRQQQLTTPAYDTSQPNPLPPST